MSPIAGGVTEQRIRRPSVRALVQPCVSAERSRPLRAPDACVLRFAAVPTRDTPSTSCGPVERISCGVSTGTLPASRESDQPEPTFTCHVLVVVGCQPHAYQRMLQAASVQLIGAQVMDKVLPSIGAPYSAHASHCICQPAEQPLNTDWSTDTPHVVHTRTRIVERQARNHSSFTRRPAHPRTVTEIEPIRGKAAAICRRDFWSATNRRRTRLI